MKQATTVTISGCLVWIIAFGVISMCILQISMAVGGIIAVIGLIISAVLDFALAAPAGVLIGKLINSMKKG